ncbi:hypothetical protein BpHYR1_022284 [Brachionus plicatilis]|uniref:OTU domain-containing protein n=1 Tax=Brachionus plicatilis TaxID=10195 RepID=A0A3M7PBT5_BRAPC|nr:hypothetical protein BpHYR1_022284 [Brachionus plicatilis]
MNLFFKIISHQINSRFLLFILLDSILNCKDWHGFTIHCGHMDRNSCCEKSILKTKKKFNLNGFVPIRTLGDGDCFYRSISTLLFGTDEYYYLDQFLCFILFFAKFFDLTNELNFINNLLKKFKIPFTPLTTSLKKYSSLKKIFLNKKLFISPKKSPIQV